MDLERATAMNSFKMENLAKGQKVTENPLAPITPGCYQINRMGTLSKSVAPGESASLIGPFHLQTGSQPHHLKRRRRPKQ